MNYEHSALSDINAKIEQINTLLEEVKADFNESKANELLKGSFDELALKQSEKLVESTAAAFVELKAKMEREVSEKTSSLFGENKEELLNLVVNEINLEQISEKTAQSFLKQNENTFKEMADTLLENQNLTGFCDEKKGEINANLEQFKESVKEKENELNTALSSLESNVKRAVEIKSEKELKSYIEKNAVEVFKPFSLHFLKDSFLNDSFFRASVRAQSKIATREFLENNHLESVSEALLNINADLAKDFFNSHFIKEQAFLQSLTLSAMNLNNELRHISEALESLRAFEAGENLASKKVFKVV